MPIRARLRRGSPSRRSRCAARRCARPTLLHSTRVSKRCASSVRSACVRDKARRKGPLRWPPESLPRSKGPTPWRRPPPTRSRAGPLRRRCDAWRTRRSPTERWNTSPDGPQANRWQALRRNHPAHTEQGLRPSARRDLYRPRAPAGRGAPRALSDRHQFASITRSGANPGRAGFRAQTQFCDRPQHSSRNRRVGPDNTCIYV